MTSTRLRIVLAADMATTADQAGWTWVVLHYLLGFRRLGHDVSLINPISAHALTPDGCCVTRSHTAARFRSLTSAFGVECCSSLLLADDPRSTVGASYDALVQAARASDVLINVSGVLRDERILAAASCRLYLDVDPGFTQLWQAVEGVDMHFAAHTHFATLGQDIGRPPSSVPSFGYCWIPTRQPIVLDRWPVARTISWDAFTTVANWRGYGSIRRGEVLYGQKAHSIRELLDLPAHTPEALILALAIDARETHDLEALRVNGWRLIDPTLASGTPEQYQSFIQGSKAELAIAKSGYVAARSGWFSDRSVCYLASGRPVLAQDTGLDSLVPTGEGLLTFQTVDEATAGIERITSDYTRHAQAARDLAEQWFDSDRVLSELLEAVGRCPP